MDYLTVGELRKRLLEFPDDAPVLQAMRETFPGYKPIILHYGIFVVNEETTNADWWGTSDANPKAVQALIIR